MTGHLLRSVPKGRDAPRCARMGLLISLSLVLLCLGIALGAGIPSASGRSESPPRLGQGICGEISTDATWTTAESPYQITCDTALLPDVTLTIEPDVEVRFAGDFTLTISGTLQATGVPDRPITFTSGQPEPAPGDWDSLYFVAGSSDSHLAWCVVEYATNGLHIYAGPGEMVGPAFSDCVVRQNAEHGIRIEAKTHACTMGLAQPTITGCLVEDNGVEDNDEEENDECGILGYGYGDEDASCSEFTGGSVGGVVSGSAIRQNGGPGICLYSELYNFGHGDVWIGIEANVISGNAGHGLVLYGDDPVHPRIENNLIYGNAGAGLRSEAKPGVHELPVVNNTVFGNGGDGMAFAEFAELVRLGNNIVAANGGYGLVCGAQPPQSANNDLWDNASGDYSGCAPGISDIAADPLLLDPVAGDFRLSFRSSCVDAGTSDGAPATDIEGIVRPWGAGVDIGAHELRYQRIYLPVILRD